MSDKIDVLAVTDRYYIDAAMLRKRGACEGQVGLFVQTFGEGPVLVNLANVKKAIAAELYVDWPIMQAWVDSDCGGAAEDAAWRAHRKARSAKGPREMLAALSLAPALWQMIDAERATGGHR